MIWDVHAAVYEVRNHCWYDSPFQKFSKFRIIWIFENTDAEGDWRRQTQKQIQYRSHPLARSNVYEFFDDFEDLYDCNEDEKNGKAAHDINQPHSIANTIVFFCWVEGLIILTHTQLFDLISGSIAIIFIFLFVFDEGLVVLL